MSKKQRGAPVVIVHKDTRLCKGLHQAAFLLTGRTSGVVTAAKAGANAAHNARTRQPQDQAEEVRQGERDVLHGAGAWADLDAFTAARDARHLER